jgi:hypothetical protein
VINLHAPSLNYLITLTIKKKTYHRYKPAVLEDGGIRFNNVEIPAVG